VTVVAATDICRNVNFLYKKRLTRFVYILLDQFLDNKVAYTTRYPGIGQRANKF
jgi:hypothetical protein